TSLGREFHLRRDLAGLAGPDLTFVIDVFARWPPARAGSMTPDAKRGKAMRRLKSAPKPSPA
ncbi:MAG: hypothetical protein Q8L92_02145, partial [Rubrivivax sp.]|nr:hypothetical protein [Rubrivivax sp.]